jgi:hypothetical protein
MVQSLGTATVLSSCAASAPSVGEHSPGEVVSLHLIRDCDVNFVLFVNEHIVGEHSPIIRDCDSSG